MPTFCRHNRFVERCPICSRTLPGNQPSGARSPRAGGGASRARSVGEASRTRRPRSEGLRVHREGRAEDDGYRSELLPGVRASADASRLADEIAFSRGRLLALAAHPPGLYGDVRALAPADRERATWTCFLIAYLAPLQGEDPFAGIREALAASTGVQPPDLEGIALGPRTSHEPGRGAGTLIAYRQWVQRSGGTQAAAFSGDPAWSPERRFERLFERLSLPGLGRTGRYELLVTLGRLGLYDLQPDSLQLAGVRGSSSSDPTTVAAKRVFGIGDPLLLERRAATLAREIGAPIETLDLALANWASQQRATMGFSEQASDAATLEHAREALGL